MIIVSTTEFRSNLKKYLALAEREQVKLKSSSGVIFDITPSSDVSFNPSPSGDPYFDNPENMAELNRRIMDLGAGKTTFLTWESIKNSLGL